MKYLLAFGTYFLSMLAQASCPSVSNKVEQLISEHVQAVQGGEYCKFRTTYKEENMELVLYTIEGPCYKTKAPAGSCGNHYFRSMVGIINGKQYPPTVVGGKGVFQSKNISHSEGLITITGLSYQKSDPACCPSLDDQRMYKISELEFEQVKP